MIPLGLAHLVVRMVDITRCSNHYYARCDRAICGAYCLITSVVAVRSVESTAGRWTGVIHCVVEWTRRDLMDMFVQSCLDQKSGD